MAVDTASGGTPRGMTGGVLGASFRQLGVAGMVGLFIGDGALKPVNGGAARRPDDGGFQYVVLVSEVALTRSRCVYFE